MFSPIVGGWAQDACNDPRRVVGGENTNIKEHPWQVALDLRRGLCGGSLIYPNWVLTAAHCFGGSKNPDDVRIKAGVNNYRIGGAWTAVNRVVVHEAYNPATNENDLALVKLKARPAGEPIELARPEDEPQICEALEVTGWGRTSEGGTTSQTLQKATVPYVATATCNAQDAYDGKIRPGMLCAGFAAGGVDACQGDSGGPLVLRRDGKPPVLIGVVGWGEGCARKLKYGVYARVSAFRSWIERIVKDDRR